MFYKRYLILFIGSLIFVSCNSFKVLNASKQKVLPGVSNSESYFLYQLTIKINKETLINKIILNNNITIKDYTITATESNLQSAHNNSLKNGTYLLQFNQSKNKVEELTNDSILLEYQQESIDKSLLVTTKKGTLITLK